MMTGQKIWRYTETREDRLLRLICFLWYQITPQQREELKPGIHEQEMGWALPSWEHRDDDDWLTVNELAADLGMTPSGIRNWQSRYGLKPIDGRYRWADVKEAKDRRNLQKRRNQAS
jgi:hypothetical protein